MTSQLFIADLHLSAQRPKITQHFLNFIQTKAIKADHLYILGDLFDVWIGDDNDSPFIQLIQQALASLKTHNTQLSIQHGNRDFLIGQAFCQTTHAQLLPDIFPIQLQKQHCLLMHGDLLCTDDIAYQDARNILRNPNFIQNFLAKSIEERTLIAAEYREKSGETTSLLPQDIMDINFETLYNYFNQHQVDTIIHGHTHRPNQYHYRTNQQEKHRYVLPDWDDQSSGYLSVNDQLGFQLIQNSER